MKIRRIPVIVCSIFLLSFHNSKMTAPDHKDGKWISLFNGRNLDHWIPKIAGYKPGDNFGNTFRVQDGILSTRYDQYGHFNNRFGALYYDKKFINFRLRLEYRFEGDTTAGAPSWGYKDGGIQYDCQPPETLGLDQPFPICLEYNLLGGNGKEERATGEICASGIYVTIDGKRNTSYCTPPFIKRTFAGNQWVTAEVEIRDGRITHYVNGEQILKFEDPRYDSTNVLAKKFIQNGNNVVRGGYISLQSNSHPMDFRKIEIMEY